MTADHTLAAPLLPYDGEGVPGLLSVVVKCYNEEKHIARCLRSILAATADMPVEVILADSGSTDATVAIASTFPIVIVQLAPTEQRCCAAVAQLGYQFARGEYLLLVDGDMEVLPEFVAAALEACKRDPTLAAVGGHLIEMSKGFEYQERVQRWDAQGHLKVPKRVTGCGMYRAAALRDVGFFMNRNLFSTEELELGLRLLARGWQLRLLPVPTVRHYGHDLPALELLRRRWINRYHHGAGQLLRCTWGTPRFLPAARNFSLFLGVIGWWGILLALVALTVMDGGQWAAILLFTLLAPLLAASLRKRSLRRGAYAALAWQVHALALLHGLFLPQSNPARPLRGTVLQERSMAPAPPHHAMLQC
jgi:glycosyltransferase involved in cell wall biosynthesis